MYADSECKEETKLDNSNLFTKFIFDSCTDPDITVIREALEEADLMEKIQMVDAEGEDTKEFYNRLEKEGWNLDPLKTEVEFLKTLKSFLRSGDYRLIATLIGVDLSEVTKTTIKVRCPYDRMYLKVDYYKDSTLCMTQPHQTYQIPWYECTQIPKENLFIKLTPS